MTLTMTMTKNLLLDFGLLFPDVDQIHLTKKKKKKKKSRRNWQRKRLICDRNISSRMVSSTTICLTHSTITITMDSFSDITQQYLTPTHIPITIDVEQIL